jgi:hypothetical protein
MICRENKAAKPRNRNTAKQGVCQQKTTRDSSVGIALGYGLEIGVPVFDSRRGLGIFLFTIVFRTVLGPTQPHIQWVTGALCLGVKRPAREADNSPPRIA